MKAIKKNQPGTSIVLRPKTHATETILAQLNDHLTAINKRFETAKFALKVVKIEIREWSILEKQAETKLNNATKDNALPLKRLHGIARVTLERYTMREPDLTTIVDDLKRTKDRIVHAIRTVESDQKLRSVSDLFNVDVFESLNFNLETEGEEIRKLCYTADALLELQR